MMFMIGQGERTVVVGPAESRHCPRCDEERDFVPQLKYSFGQFDLLFGFVYGKRYQLACPECRHGWILDAKTVEAGLDRSPIPFHLRYGFLVLIALAAVLVAAVYAYRHSG